MSANSCAERVYVVGLDKSQGKDKTVLMNFSAKTYQKLIKGVVLNILPPLPCEDNQYDPPLVYDPWKAEYGGEFLDCWVNKFGKNLSVKLDLHIGGSWDKGDPRKFKDGAIYVSR